MPAKLLSILLVSLLTLLVAGRVAAEDPREDYREILDKAFMALNDGDEKQAVALANQAIALQPNWPDAYGLRSALRQRADDFAGAEADLTKIITLHEQERGNLKGLAEVFDQRGQARFKQGKVEESVADFDKTIELEPKRFASHWQRGIACYYAGKFDGGVKQFEAYQDFDNSDVENAVWRFLCQAKRDGFAKARADILKIGDDRRVPMRQIYDLFAGKTTEDAVLAAARAGEPDEQTLNRRLFYAYQYLGLYAEAQDRPADALKYTKLAVDHPIGHYMHDVARVHLKRLEEKR